MTYDRTTQAALLVLAIASMSTYASAQTGPSQGYPAPGYSPPPQPAPDDGVVRPSSRATFASFSLGPSFGLTGCGDGGCTSARNFTQIKLAQEIGYHVSGNGKGFALGGSMEEGFGDNLIRLQPGFKMWWDIQPSSDLGFYIAPTMKLGYAFFTVDAGIASADTHTFNAQVGVEGKIVLADRAIVFLRPFTLDTFTNEDGVLLTYDVMVGGAVTF